MRTNSSYSCTAMAVKESVHCSLNLFSKICLRDGNLFPIFGLGTWRAEKDDCKNAALHAISLGYRLLDTASSYGNEQEVGEAVRECGVPREELFITGKLWVPDHGKDGTQAAFKETMEKFGLDYLDLYLIHSPTGGKIIETWDTMVDLQNKGYIRSIGVSNFNTHHLQKLIEARPDNVPAVNQIELSPFLTREEIVDFCKSQDISVQAFSPLTKGKYLKDEQLMEMADRYNKSVAQLLIRWSIQRGYTCIPKSITNSRIEENCQIFDFVITDTDMANMNGWNRNLVTDWNVINSEWIS